jgi:hypothetical protein
MEIPGEGNKMKAIQAAANISDDYSSYVIFFIFLLPFSFLTPQSSNVTMNVVFKETNSKKFLVQVTHELSSYDSLFRASCDM